MKVILAPSWDIQAAKAIFGKGEIVRQSAISCKILLLTAVVWAIHWVHVPILRIKKTSADFGLNKTFVRIV